MSGMGIDMRLAMSLAVAGLALVAPRAAAIETVHVGVLKHNLGVLNEKTANREDGYNVEVQADFGSPAVLRWAFAPKPFVVASLNTAGDTSFAGVGLQWRVGLGENWSIDPALGYVIHDGEISNPFRNGDPRATQFSETNLLYGSRDLFRTAIGVTRDLPGPWAGQLFYNHLSHGQILGNGRNQGVDQVGLRVGYTFAK